MKNSRMLALQRRRNQATRLFSAFIRCWGGNEFNVGCRFTAFVLLLVSTISYANPSHAQVRIRFPDTTLVEPLVVKPASANVFGRPDGEYVYLASSTRRPMPNVQLGTTRVKSCDEACDEMIPFLSEPWATEPSLPTVIRFSENAESIEPSLLAPPFPASSSQPLHFNDPFDPYQTESPWQSSSKVYTPPIGPRPWIGQRFLNDQYQFYNRDSLLLLTGGFVVGGVMANTNLDQQLYDSIQQRVSSSDGWSRLLHGHKDLGNGYVTVPIVALVWGVGSQFPESALLEQSTIWSERTIRGFAVGAVPVIVLQAATGGSRPTDTEHSSHWHPFRDNNGVSGHSFISAMPFITAAKMTDVYWQKGLWYAGSTVGPLSRINDGAHYPSQALLGWWVAYVSATAVQRSDTFNQQWQLAPYATPDGYGLMGTYRW